MFMRYQSLSLRYRLDTLTFTNRIRVDDEDMISMKMLSRVLHKTTHSAAKATPRNFFLHVRKSVNIRNLLRGTSRALESLKKRSPSDRTVQVSSARLTESENSINMTLISLEYLKRA